MCESNVDSVLVVGLIFLDAGKMGHAKSKIFSLN